MRDIWVLPGYLTASGTHQGGSHTLTLGSSIICREKYGPDAREKREDIAIIDEPTGMQGESSGRIESWNIYIRGFLFQMRK